jgi:lysophospholipase L1-like esterase
VSQELSRQKRRTFVFSGILLLILSFLLLEGLGQILYRSVRGRWFFRRATVHARMFEPHPWLVGRPKPGARVTGNISISHNALGYRGPEFALDKSEGEIRVVAYGGSSTYCVRVSDEQTWPYLLGQKLGTPYQVINAGSPGYSTAEAIIQSALQQMDLAPDISVYYVGWNDIRNMHVEGLTSDYAAFHGRSQISNLGLDQSRWANQLVLVGVFRGSMEGIFKRGPGAKGEIRSGIDKRAVEIYKHNLRLLVHLTRFHDSRILLVPQMLNKDQLTEDRPYGWIPFVSDRDLPRLMSVYNDTMLSVCEEERVPCVDSVLGAPWQPSDFADHGHFSAEGNEKFASLLAEAVQSLGMPGASR